MVVVVVVPLPAGEDKVAVVIVVVVFPPLPAGEDKVAVAIVPFGG